MGKKEYQFLRSVLLFTDFMLINLAAGLSILFSYTNIAPLFFGLAMLGVNVTWLASAYFFKLYYYTTISKIENTYRQSWRVLAVQILGLYGIQHLINISLVKLNYLNKATVIYFGIATFLLLISRFFQTYLVEFFLKRFKIRAAAARKIAIIGNNDKAQQLAEYFQKNQRFYQLQAFFNDGKNPQLSSNNPAYPIENFVDYAVENNIQEVYSTVLPSEHPGFPELVKKAEANLVRLRFVAASQTKATVSDYNFVEVDRFNQLPIMALRNEPLDTLYSRFKKRLFDLLVSSFVIVFIMSWLTPLLGLIIKLSSKGPIFFVQDRSGKDNETFRCFKFRSMTMNKDSDKMQAVKNDARITKIGAFMRKTSLDEFPQFFNVFMGDMSICGPRPHMLKHTEEYSKIIEQYMIRHFLKPGVTGWAQVNGYRGETEDPALMEKRVEHDIWYMENWSLALDIRIIFLTVFNIFKGEDKAY